MKERKNIAKKGKIKLKKKAQCAIYFKFYHL